MATQKDKQTLSATLSKVMRERCTQANYWAMFRGCATRWEECQDGARLWGRLAGICLTWCIEFQEISQVCRDHAWLCAWISFDNYPIAFLECTHCLFIMRNQSKHGQTERLAGDAPVLVHSETALFTQKFVFLVKKFRFCGSFFFLSEIIMKWRVTGNNSGRERERWSVAGWEVTKPVSWIQTFSIAP